MKLKHINYLVVIVCFMVFIISCAEIDSVKLIPTIDGEWWDIGPEPDLTSLGLQPSKSKWQPNQPNDHHIFQDKYGKWHLWACVRGTKVGRILVHWDADSVTQSPWRYTEEVIRCDRNAGESLVEWQNQEFLQSPYIVKENDKYYMFYGGYDTGLDPHGNKINPAEDYDSAEKQICLMISDDGVKWERYKNEEGYSRVFVGPGAARDPCFVKFGDTWYAYYCGHHHWDRTCGALYVRMSKDLIHWSDWKIAQYDKASENRKWLPESPCVVQKGEWYYLFRTHGPKGGVYVYRSKDPLNFGQGDVSDYFVTRFDTMIACEIIEDEKGNEYISNITDGKKYGIRLAELKWIRK